MSEKKCNEHPLAPHGFDRNGSHSADRYVCDCEGWAEPTKEELYSEIKRLQNIEEKAYIYVRDSYRPKPKYDAKRFDNLVLALEVLKRDHL